MASRIGHVLLLDSWGGVENWYVDLAKNGFFSEGNHTVYGVAKNMDDKVVATFSKYVTVVHLPVNSFPSLVRFIARTQLDFLYNHSYFRGALVVLLFKLLTNVKVITHNHSAALVKTKRMRDRVFLEVLRRIVVFCTDKRVAVSKIAAQDLYDSTKEVTIISCKLVKYTEKRALKIAQNQSKPIRLLHVGRIFNSAYFEDAKNQSFIIDVLYWLQLNKVNFKMTFCGGGDNSFLEKKISFLGIDRSKIKFEQHVDVFEELNQTDLFLFPSKHEGYGMALVEAQYANVYSFASNFIPNEAIINKELVKKLPIGLEDARVWAKEIGSYKPLSILNDTQVTDYDEYLHSLKSIFS